MTRAARFLIFLFFSLASLVAAGVLLVGEVNRYNAGLALFPPGTLIAGIPTGGLDGQAAAERLAQAYALTPVELRIDETVVQIDPTAAGQILDLQGMVDAAAGGSRGRSYWQGFWDFLLNRAPAAATAGLNCSVDAQRLQNYLNTQIGARYDLPPSPAGPAAIADVLFRPGQPGETLDLAASEPAIRQAMCEPAPRVVTLTSTTVAAPPPSVDRLGLLLETLVNASGFDGAVEVYYQDLATGKEVNFAFNHGREVTPGIAFTAASTIKIPVMVAAYRRINGPLPDELRSRMALMIDLSDNGSTDEVMKQALDPNIAPVQVTEDMQALGLKNTFLAGFFYPGAPLLDKYNTPANTRTDISTEPDIYNQTTAEDMGRLLAAIQRCAASGAGPLIDTFHGSITQAECQEMTGFLDKNRKAVLFEAGLPEGTRVAHKYGWVTDPADGLMHNASDAAIIYTPGGDFVLTIYLDHREQLQWDPAQRLAARLATAVDNFYNGWQKK